MNGQIDMTALQMYLELQQFGLRSAGVVPSGFRMLSAYRYVPTQLVYSTSNAYAELVRNTVRDPEGGAHWKPEDAWSIRRDPSQVLEEIAE